jgi:hypothetical protein
MIRINIQQADLHTVFTFDKSLCALDCECRLSQSLYANVSTVVPFKNVQIAITFLARRSELLSETMLSASYYLARTAVYAKTIMLESGGCVASNSGERHKFKSRET